MDVIEALIRLVEGAIEQNRAGPRQRTPILDRPRQQPRQLPGQAQRRMPLFDPRVPQPRAPAGNPRVQQRRPGRAAQARGPIAAPPPIPTVQPKIPDTPPLARPAAATRIDARSLHRWLNPATLRRQFILTEILQPPVALRENHLR